MSYRMKYFVFVLSVGLFGFKSLSQNACDNHEKIKVIPSTIDNEAAKFAKTYWAKRCACETGNIINGSWDYSVEIMNNMYDHYQKPGVLDGYKGPDFPIPNKRMHVSDCKNSDNDTYSVTTTNCGTPAFTNEQDPQQYGNAFMLARCQCMEGVPYEEQAKQLAAQMEVNFNNANRVYGKSRLNLPEPLEWGQCPLIRLGQDPTIPPGSRDKWAMYSDDLINRDAQNLIHQLAEGSDDPTLKQFSQDLKTLDNTNQAIADYNAFFNITQSQRDAEFQQVMNNAGQIIAIGKAVVSLFKDDEPKNEPWSQEQLNGKAFIKSLKQKMRALADEEIRVPNKVFKGEVGIRELNEIEAAYYAYDIATAVERWMLFKYYYSRHRWTPEELEDLHKELTAVGTESVLRTIDDFQQKADLSNFEFAANADVRRRQRLNLIKIKKANCYREMAREDEAKKLISEVRFDGDLSSYLYDLERNELFTGEYSSAQTNYQLLKTEAYIESEELKKFKKARIVKLLAIGLSQKEPYENISEVENELEFIKQYSLTPYKWDNSTYQNECNLYLNTLEALVALRKGNYEDANEYINKAFIELSVAENKAIISWVEFAKFKVLVESNKYDEAMQMYDKQMHYLNSNWKPDFYFNVNDLRFMKCRLLYNNKEYDRALKGLDLIESSTGKTDRILTLQARIYNAKGDIEKAKEIINY